MIQAYKQLPLCLMLLMIFSLVEAQAPDIPTIFQQQIEKSCESATGYSKTLTEGNAQAKPETRNQNFKNSDECQTLLGVELSYAVKKYYADKFIVDYYDIEQSGDTLYAHLKTSRPNASELKHQKIIYEPDSKKLRYIESLIKWEYWLYDIHMYIKVSFDAQGRYAHHSLRTYTDVLMLGDAFETHITGKASYDE